MCVWKADAYTHPHPPNYHQDKPLGKLTWNFNTATAMVDSEWVESKSRASSGFSNPAREEGGRRGATGVVSMNLVRGCKWRKQEYWREFGVP